MSKRFLFIFIADFLIFGLRGQVLPELGTSQEILEPSPQAASLGQYGFLPPNKYQGTPNISIPIHEIEFEELDIPISLSYYMPGLRPNEEASWVGLGWTLNATSVITRSIKGRDDLLNRSGDTQIGWIYRLPLLELTDDPEDGYWDGATQTLLSNSDLNTFESGRDIDMEPDIWSINLFGKSLKFILGHYDYDSGDPEIEVILLNEKNYKISFNKDTQIFKVIDPLGYEYIYDLILVSESGGSFYHQGFWNTPITWYLTEIKSPGPTLKTLKFNYSPKTIVKSGRNWTSFGIGNYNITRGNWIVGNQNPENRMLCDNFFNSKLQFDVGGSLQSFWLGLSYSMSEEVYLSSINNGREKITFITSSRDDLEVKNEGLETYKLNRLEVSFDDDIKKVADFHYSYFNANNSYENKLLYYRLKLDKAIINNQEYSFSYNAPNNLPSKETKEIDWWGYYNGKDPGYFMFPPHSDYSSNWENEETYGFYRNPDENFARIGTLNTINYPTGGSSRFYYEANVAQLKDNQIYEWEDSPSLLPDGPYRNVEIGGLRLSRVDDYDINGEIIRSSEYSYVDETNEELSSGLLLDEEMKFREDFEIYKLYSSICTPEICSTQDPVNYYDGCGGSCEAQYSLLKSNPVTKLVSLADGSFFGYSRVIETIKNVKDPNKSHTIISDFANKQFQVGVIGGYSDKAISYFSASGCSEYVKPLSVYNVKWPRSLSSENGKIKREKFYNEHNILVKVNDYSYKSLGEEERYYAGITTFGGYLSGRTVGTNTRFVAFQNYPIWIRKSILSSQIETTNYQEREIFTSVGYGFNEYWLKSNESISGSLGIEQTKYYYPHDYINEEASDLIEINIISKPIKIERIRNGNLVSGTVYDYDPFGKVEEVFTYESSTLNPPGVHDPTKLIPPGYVSESTISYGGNRVSEVEDKSGITKSYIWSYDKRYPIASVINAGENEIAYSSFEVGFDSWQIGYGKVHDDAVTGSKCIEPLGSTLRSNHQFPAGTYKVSMYLKSSDGSGAVYIQNQSGMQPFWVGNNEWRFSERIVTLSSSDYITLEPSIGSGIYFDEVRVTPIDSEMTTYTYDPLVGITSIVDPNGIIQFFHYDDNGRLIEVRDHEGVLLKAYSYNLATE